MTNLKELDLIDILEDKKNVFKYIDTNDIFYNMNKDKKNFIITSNKKIDKDLYEENNILDNLFLPLSTTYNENKIDMPITIVSSMISSTNKEGESYTKIYRFENNKFKTNKEMYYRLIILHTEKIEINYEERFEFEFLKGLNFKIKGKLFNLCHQDKYLIIEAKDKIDFNTFEIYTKMALSAFGYLNDFIPMDCGYYFNYEDFEQEYIGFYYNSQLYGTYKSIFKIFSTDPYDYFKFTDLNNKFNILTNEFIKDKELEKLEKMLKTIPISSLERLIELMLDNNYFREFLYSLLSINQINGISFYLKCGLYSISLEMISSIIINDKTLNKKILKDKLNLTKEQKEELTKALNSCAESFYNGEKLKFGDKAIDTIKIKNEEYLGSRVEKRINSGCIYAEFNSNKLTEPYELLDIKLNKYEIENIKLRNKFLHGDFSFIFKNLPIDNQIDYQNKLIFFITLELHFLVNSLVFKYIGFDGILKNLSKILLDKYDFPEIKDRKAKVYKSLKNFEENNKK